MRDKWKAAKASRGKERGKKGSRGRDKGGQNSTEKAARDTGQWGDKAKGRGRRVAMGTWARRCSQGRGWDGGEV